MATGGGDACDQPALEGPIAITGFREAGTLPGSWRIGLRRRASHDLSTTLGLAHRTHRVAGVTRDVLELRFAGWMRFLAEAQPAQVVWEAP